MTLFSNRSSIFFASPMALDPRRSAGDTVLLDELIVLGNLCSDIYYTSMEFVGKKNIMSEWILDKNFARIVRCEENRNFEQIIEQLPNLDVAYLATWKVAENFIPIINERFPAAKIIFNPVDLHFLRMDRGQRLGYTLENEPDAEETQSRELAVIEKSDVTLVYSDFEKQLINNVQPSARVEVCPWMIPLQPSAKGYKDKNTISFLGHFYHQPNVDAVTYLAKEILPELQSAGFDHDILVFGDRSRQKVGHLACKGLSVRGEVEELDSIFDECRVAIAPLRFGAGKKGKVAQALARGVPTVLTSIAAEGFGLESGHNAIIADDPKSLAAAIVELYGNEELWSRISKNSLQYAAAHFDPARGRKFFSSLLYDLTASQMHPLKRFIERFRRG